MDKENEFGFVPDTPEAYAADAILNEVPEDAPTNVGPSDDIDSEPAADEPVVVVPQVATPVATVVATPGAFDRNQPIQGLKEEENQSLEDTALRTKEILSKQPKVRMMIPLDPGEKAGAYRTVIINGYRFDVRKNTMIDLPEAVAALLSDAYQITTDVLENNPLNLNQANDGKRSALGL